MCNMKPWFSNTFTMTVHLVLLLVPLTIVKSEGIQQVGLLLKCDKFSKK